LWSEKSRELRIIALIMMCSLALVGCGGGGGGGGSSNAAKISISYHGSSKPLVSHDGTPVTKLKWHYTDPTGVEKETNLGYASASGLLSLKLYQNQLT
jgi:hypothetical protein